MTVRVELTPAMFGEIERPIAVMGGFAVLGFRYPSGVEALRLKTPRANIIVLPFKGQQIWRAVFDGRDLTMRSMFPEPRATDVYLETYGAFLLHCGLTAMGVPGPDDHHPLHGELPNAKMDSACLRLDEHAQTVTISGTYQHTVAFTCNYVATPEITLAADSTELAVSLQVRNLRRSPMELMYLAHANFRPVDHGKLAYAAPYTADAVRVRTSIPSHIRPPPCYTDFIAALDKDPTLHHSLHPDQAFDPEVAFMLSMIADDDGWTHAMQQHPNGDADFISFRPDQAPMTARWICRTPDQDGLGIAFPSTAGVEGYAIEKAKGRIVEVPAEGQWRIDMRLGALNGARAKALSSKIDRIAGRS